MHCEKSLPFSASFTCADCSYQFVPILIEYFRRLNRMTREQQIVTDRKTMNELVEFMEDAVKEGLSSEEINSQVDLLLDAASRGRLEKSLKEARRGNPKRFKEPQALLKSLHHP